MRAQLDDATFAAAWAEGQALPVEQAIAYALEQDPGSPEATTMRSAQRDSDVCSTLGTASDDAGRTSLTAREREVLRLVAQGLRTGEVAAALDLSPLTVNVHLRAIYRKLGVRSRTAATRVAIEQQLV